MYKGENYCGDNYTFASKNVLESDGLAFYFPKKYYNYLLEIGHTQEDVDELYRKQMSK